MKRRNIKAGAKLLLATTLLMTSQSSVAYVHETHQPLPILALASDQGRAVGEGIGEGLSPLSLYMQKYSSTWNRQSHSDDADIVGKAMPEFYFTKQLNSKALKGKTVVLTFWATWCGGCRLLSADLDSVMVKHSDEYKDIQIIGVDSDEKLVNKGYAAQKWWQEKGIGFPTTAPGKAADACGKSINAGHPTTVIIDGEGIVRGRWDAWTPDVANNVALAAWVIDIAPRQGITPTVENVNKCLAENHTDRALYLLEQMPEDTLTMPQRWEALMGVSAREAEKYYDSLAAKYEAARSEDNWRWEPSPEYVAIMRAFSSVVYAKAIGDVQMLRRAASAARLVANWQRTDRVKNSLKADELSIRYGNAVVRQACQSIYSMKSENRNLTPEDKTLVDETIGRYGITEEQFGDHDPVHMQMARDKKEQAEKIKSVKK